MFKTCRCASLGYDQLHQRLKRCKHDYSSSTYVACKCLSAVKGDASAILLRGNRMRTTHVGRKAWPLRLLPCRTASLAPSKKHSQRHTCNMQQSRLCSKTHDAPSTCSTACYKSAVMTALTWGTLSSRTYFSRTRGAPGASSSLTAASLKTCSVPSTSATFESYSIHCFAAVLFLM